MFHNAIFFPCPLHFLVEEKHTQHQGLGFTNMFWITHLLDSLESIHKVVTLACYQMTFLGLHTFELYHGALAWLRCLWIHNSLSGWRNGEVSETDISYSNAFLLARFNILWTTPIVLSQQNSSNKVLQNCYTHRLPSQLSQPYLWVFCRIESRSMAWAVWGWGWGLITTYFLLKGVSRVNQPVALLFYVAECRVGMKITQFGASETK